MELSLSEISVRMIDTQDFDSLSLFFSRNNVPEVTKHFHPFPLNEQSAKRISRTVHLDRYYIAFNKAWVVGFCMLRGWDQGFQVPSFGMLVDYDFRKHGLGRRLLEFSLVEARSLGCPAVRLSVYASNEVAVKIYLSLGFKELDREPCTIAGLADEKIVMRKDFDPPIIGDR